MRLSALIAMLGIGAVGLYFVPGPPEEEIDWMTSASIGPAVEKGADREYSVANLSGGSACIVKRGEAVTARSRSFEAGSDCDEVWSGLAEASNWAEQSDGSVILSDGSGRAILTLAPADGVAYETLDPPNASLTLTIIR